MSSIYFVKPILNHVHTKLQGRATRSCVRFKHMKCSWLLQQTNRFCLFFFFDVWLLYWRKTISYHFSYLSRTFQRDDRSNPQFHSNYPFIDCINMRLSNEFFFCQQRSQYLSTTFSHAEAESLKLTEANKIMLQAPARLVFFSAKKKVCKHILLH